MKKVGYLESCPTPLCGSVSGYFCVRCQHFVCDCLCTPGSCQCDDSQGWASEGERKLVLKKLGLDKGNTL